MKRKDKLLAILMLSVFLFVMVCGSASVSAASGANYDLEGWNNHKEGSWTDGALKGYTELDWVKFRLGVEGYVAGDATKICIQHDHKDDGIYGYQTARNFYIGDANETPLYYAGGGVFHVTGPTTESNGITIMEYCFIVDDVSTLTTLGDFYFYWETQLAGPKQASTWNGNSLHTTTSVTGAQTVPISTKEIEPLPAPGIMIDKTVSPSTAEPGDTVTYTFTVTNTGNIDLTDVTVTDPLFAGLTGWPYVIGDLAVDGSESFSEDYTFSSETPLEPFVNTAEVTADSDDGAVSGTDDETVLIQKASIEITKDVSPAAAAPGGEVTYTFTVTNTGNLTLTGVTVTDPLFGSGWFHLIGEMAGGAEETFTVPYTIPVDAELGAMENTATAMGYYNQDPVSDTDDASVNVVIGPYPGIGLLKEADVETVGPEDTIVYTFTVTNTGTQDLIEVTVTDPLFGTGWSHFVGDLAAESNPVTFSESYVVPADAETGTLENTATVDAVSINGRPVSDTAAETVAIVVPGDASMEVDKTASPGTVEPGDTVTYTVLVTNNGDYDLVNLVLTDDKMGTSWFEDLGDLDMGMTTSFIYQYQVSPGAQEGELVNTATVDAGYGEGETLTVSDQATVLIEEEPGPGPSCDLNLYSICSVCPDITRSWRVYNNGSSTVSFNWELLDGDLLPAGQSGSADVSSAEDVFIVTQTISGENWLKITYGGECSETVLSGGVQCDLEPITIHSVCTDTPRTGKIEWQFHNTNDFVVPAEWEVEDQFGSILLMPGINLLYTDVVDGSPNTMTLYVCGEPYAVETRACYQDIRLDTRCSEDPRDHLVWIITNNNFYPVEVEWVLVDSEGEVHQTGALTMNAEDSRRILTDTIAGDNFMGLFVDEVLQEDGWVLGDKEKCSDDRDDDDDDDDEPTPPPTPPVPPVVPTLPGGEIIIENVVPSAPAPIEELPATGGGTVVPYYLAGAALISGGLVLRRKSVR